MRTNILKNTIPFLMLFGLLGMLWQSLGMSHATTVQNAMAGEKLPYFKLRDIRNPTRILSSSKLKGKVVLLNYWASWCPACRSEHEMLMDIKKNYHIPIYGITYKDNRNDTLRFLSDRGDPYKLIGSDTSGDLAVDFGIYGTPETFIISKKGRIIYRHIGVISPRTWQRVLLPIIKKYS